MLWDVSTRLCFAPGRPQTARLPSYLCPGTLSCRAGRCEARGSAWCRHAVGLPLSPHSPQPGRFACAAPLRLLVRPPQIPAHGTQAWKLWLPHPLRRESRLPVLDLRLCLVRSHHLFLIQSDLTTSLLFALNTCLTRLIPE